MRAVVRKELTGGTNPAPKKKKTKNFLSYAATGELPKGEKKDKNALKYSPHEEPRQTT